MKIETYPWEYSIVLDYYDQKLFVKMQNELIHFVESSKLKIKNKTLNENTIFRFSLTNINNKPVWKCKHTNTLKLFPHTTECLSVKHICEDDLRYFSYHRQYEKSLTLNTTICIIFNNDVREDDDPIHYDSPSKVLTAVTYVSPELSRGTILYDCNRKYVTEAAWKPNLTLIFPPKDFVTWHSYETIKGQYRIAINQFLKK